MNSTAIVTGSLTDVARANNTSVAQSFLGCEILALVDTSASMDTADSRGCRRRYDVACEELTAVQERNPGKVGVVSFSSDAIFCPDGIPLFLGAGTDLAGALDFAKVADGAGIRIVVISDGEPDEPMRALTIARTFTSPIDCIYVGPETGREARAFLDELAQRAGGRSMVADRADLLADKVQLLLGAGTR